MWPIYIKRHLAAPIIMLLLGCFLSSCYKQPSHQIELDQGAHAMRHAKRTLVLLSQLSQQGVHVAQIGQAITLSFPAKNYFFNNSAHLKPESQDLISSMQKLLTHYPVNTLTISGITQRNNSNRIHRSLAIERARHLSRSLNRKTFVPVAVAQSSPVLSRHHPVKGVGTVGVPYMVVTINSRPLSSGEIYA